MLRKIVRQLRKRFPALNKLVLYIVRKRRQFRIWKKYVYPIRKEFYLHRDIYFFVYTPNHGNLGDHAIAYATETLLKRLKIRYKEITINELFEYRDLGMLNAFNKANILINGGGNLGTLWINCEQLTRDIILSNPDSKIVILPNTFYYEDTAWGQEELQKSIEIYNSHKELYIFARETISFEAMKKVYNNVFLAPDMVFLADYPHKSDHKRSGCLLCLRNDREKTLSEDEKEGLEIKAQALFSNIQYTDTVLLCDVSKIERKKKLFDKWNEFSSAQIVITDRLHGMIFSYITRTPCMVLNSKSPKLQGCFQWIKDCGFIKFVDSIDDIDKKFLNFLITCNKDYILPMTNFTPLISVLKGS